jgi:hypothetical protein
MTSKWLQLPFHASRTDTFLLWRRLVVAMAFPRAVILSRTQVARLSLESPPILSAIDQGGPHAASQLLALG